TCRINHVLCKRAARCNLWNEYPAFSICNIKNYVLGKRNEIRKSEPQVELRSHPVCNNIVDSVLGHCQRIKRCWISPLEIKGRREIIWGENTKFIILVNACIRSS